MMKIGIAAILSAALFLASCSASTSAAKKEKAAADFEQTTALIESGTYEFTVRSASPSGGKTIQITSEYTMKAKDGKFEALLPYFGRAYSASYGGSQSVEFSGDPKDLKITRKDNKNKISVSFNISNEAEKYTVNLEVGGSGYGTLVISNPRKQPITYNGQLSGLAD